MGWLASRLYLVHRQAQGRPGLGAHLFEHLRKRIAIVGIAKRSFAGSEFAVPVLRGTSQNPLFVTALGMPDWEAAAQVRQMHGAHRIPTLCARGRPAEPWIAHARIQRRMRGFDRPCSACLCEPVASPGNNDRVVVSVSNNPLEFQVNEIVLEETAFAEEH
ncbi:MAG: hypothetical protein U1E65_21760 [Myxococcota bacterium]